jgi:hypothetical protein
MTTAEPQPARSNPDETKERLLPCDNNTVLAVYLLVNGGIVIALAIAHWFFGDDALVQAPFKRPGCRTTGWPGCGGVSQDAGSVATRTEQDAGPVLEECVTFCKIAPFVDRKGRTS